MATGRTSHRLSFAAMNQGTTGSLESGLTDPCLALSKTTRFLTSSPHNAFLSFQAPCLWSFLTAALRNACHPLSSDSMPCPEIRSIWFDLDCVYFCGKGGGWRGALAHTPTHRAGTEPHVPRVGKR